MLDVEKTYGHKAFNWHGALVLDCNIPQPRPGCYAVVNLLNGDRYIGISSDVAKRLKKHVSSKDVRPVRLKSAVKKYGPQNFLALPLAYTLGITSDLADIEQTLISEHNSTVDGYNINVSRGRVGPYGPLFSNILRQTYSNPTVRNKLKATWTPAARSAMASRVKEAWASPGSRERYLSAALRTVYNPDNRKRHSDKMLLMWADPSYRERVRAGRVASGNYRNRICITDGVRNRRIPKYTVLEEGWRFGMTKRQPK